MCATSSVGVLYIVLQQLGEPPRVSSSLSEYAICMILIMKCYPNDMNFSALYRNGANWSLLDNTGKTFADLALRNGHNKILQAVSDFFERDEYVNLTYSERALHT